MITATRHWLGILAAVVVVALWAAGAWAQEASPLPASPGIDSGDTAWVLASSALVLAMITPGPGAVLRGAGAEQERAGHDHAKPHHSLPRELDLGPLGIQFGLWT